MLMCTATQSLSHWKAFRTNWKHCNVSIPNLCVPACVRKMERQNQKKKKKVRKPDIIKIKKSEYLSGLRPLRRTFFTQTYMHKGTGESYRLALSLSSPPASSASVCLRRLPGFLCGAQEFQTLIRSAGHFAPGPPPQACEGKWNCSGRSTGNILYCCQIPVRQTKVGRESNKGWDLY